MRTAIVITASNRAAAGVYQDLSGQALKEGLIKLGYQVLDYQVVPDEIDQISSLIKGALAKEINLIVTTGGTGISPNDFTPEATKPLIEKELPGFAEALRAYSREKVPTADLTRGLAGVTGNSLIINLPGSPGAIKDGLVIIERLAPHIHDQLAGNDHSTSN
ncbi:MAG: MogA/MoaB family molybdenum cofactor biosynthesis protein [Candidatus Nanopelagicaceae bacterium]